MAEPKFDFVDDSKAAFAKAEKRFGEKKAGFVPVVVQRCNWKQYVGEIQGLPTGGKPVSDWRPHDNACFDVEEGLRQTINEARKMLSQT